MSPDMLVSLAVQVPALAVVVYLVIHFLAYIKEMREDDRKFVADLVVDYKATVHKCDKTLEENTKAVQTFNDSASSRGVACPMMNPGRNHHAQPKPRPEGE